jgi:hypothetical protein
MDEEHPKLNALTIAVQAALSNNASSPEPMSVMTPGGRIQVRWDPQAKATAMGQLTFFAEFLEVSGLFEHWVQTCPLAYTSGNAPRVRDVLGTWMLSILDGHCRYAHVAVLRGDAVAPALLDMHKIIGDESLRRALAHIAPATHAKHNEEQRQEQQAQLARACQWMQQALQESVQHALETPWILDCDITVKPLYGRQSGAEVGYNPHKRGRPSHTIHTYWIGNLRLVLHAQIQGGKANSAKQSLPGLTELLHRLPLEQRPQLVRGDCIFGTEGVMNELEDISQPYLFKLKQSANVKRLIARQWQQHTWCDMGQGWQACEDRLKLMGWSQSRRVIVMRRAVKVDLVVETSSSHSKGSNAKSTASAKTAPQACLQLIDANCPSKVWEYAVLVTNSSYAVNHMGQLYRDRADCENGFDELKNQWGWGGYSTQDMERCNLCAQAVALIYNWWSWYVRLAHPKGRLEAISSRPLLLAAVGKVSEHAGQTRILLSVTHAAVTQIKALVANVRAGLEHIRTTAPQLPQAGRWQALVRYIVEKILMTQSNTTAQANAPPCLAMA